MLVNPVVVRVVLGPKQGAKCIKPDCIFAFFHVYTHSCTLNHLKY